MRDHVRLTGDQSIYKRKALSSFVGVGCVSFYSCDGWIREWGRPCARLSDGRRGHLTTVHP